jgi:hypothetical protein
MEMERTKNVLWVGTIGIMALGVLSVAGAQSTGPPEEAHILNGLTPERAGRIAGASLDATGLEITPSAVDITRGPREAEVAGPAAKALAPRPAGTIEEDQLNSEIAARFETLEGCRIDVARRRHVAMGDIEADRLTLRWTIDEAGAVTAATAVGTTAIDAIVLDCVKRAMTGWTFSRPSGGPLPVERVYEFPQRRRPAGPTPTFR